jgi:hypothetical protein
MVHEFLSYLDGARREELDHSKSQYYCCGMMSVKSILKRVYEIVDTIQYSVGASLAKQLEGAFGCYKSVRVLLLANSVHKQG